MGIKTDLNVAPYYDDFDSSKNFYRVLFKPEVAVQARELTQLQTILQNQIEIFGDNILYEGTIVKGCGIVEIRNLGFVKILDIETDGQPVSMSTYEEARAVGSTTGVTAKIIRVATGLESQTPDLNTIYIKYLTSGSGGEKVFADGENIEIRNFDTNTLIATVTAAGTVDAESVGDSYGVRVGDGYIYQKGHFVRVEPQIAIVKKYGDDPDGIVLGFKTTESIVTSTADTSLLDPANGAPNENAPGADRLKLTVTAVALTKAAAVADETFFTVQEYVNGGVAISNRTTQYSALGDEMARRTYEESGNYAVRPFDTRVDIHASNTDLLSLHVGAGLSYVAGRRVELTGDLLVDVPKATTSNTESQQSITTNFGHYVVIDEMMGNFDFDEHAQVTLHSAAGNRFTAGSVGTKPGGEIGTANVRSLIWHANDVGANNTQYRLYLFNIEMDSGYNFADVEHVFYDGTNKGAADVVLESGKAVIREFNFKKAIFPIGRSAVKNVPTANTDYVYRAVDESLTVSATTGVATITLSGNDQWPTTGVLNDTQKKDVVLICDETQAPFTKGQPINLAGANAVVTVAGQTMTIDLSSAANTAVDAIAYYNVKRAQAAPAGKTANTFYVKVEANTHSSNTTGKYSLGVPDVFEVVGIWQSSNNWFSESATDVTNKFRLKTRQKDAYYDLSKVVKKRSHTIGEDDVLLIKARAFKKDTSGSFAEGFFTVDSYPVDDANTANTVAITTQEIPTYKSESGVEYDLRDVIDFRPYAANTAAYATSIGSATSNPAETLSFGSGVKYFASPNEQFEMDYDYYLGRHDRFIVDDLGKFVLVQGEPAEDPIPPTPSSGMTVAELTIPPFPSLPKRVADEAGKPAFGVKLRSRDINRYTMKDIGDFDRRIEVLEYYTSLNSLENAAANMLIVDGAGLDRFKHGIFVDNFNDLSLADVNSYEYSAGIDRAYGEVIPRFRTYVLDLKLDESQTWSNVTNFSNTAVTLSKTDSEFIKQETATSFRNCVTDLYGFFGTMEIRPTYDGGPDPTIAPDINTEVDNNDFAPFNDAMNEFIANAEETTSPERHTVIGSDGTVTTVTINGNQITRAVGDFVTGVEFSPFLRSRLLRVKATGLRPNTDFYAYFDQSDISAHVAPATQSAGTSDLAGLRQSGSFGSTISSDSTGTLLMVYRIPSGTFYVGDRVLELMDVDSYTSKAAATSKTQASYHGFNFSSSSTGTTISTRIPEEPPAPPMPNNPWLPVVVDTIDVPDPIAQTFKIAGNMSNDSVVMLTKMDLFFKSKSSTKGVRVQIRETLNGYPSNKTVPFSDIHLNSADVSVSDDAQTATTVTFVAPVALKTDTEYCFAVIPDGNDPDYTIWISRLGETDVNSGLAVQHDTSNGTLFTSTNNSAWTAYQDENIKFTLYKAAFSAASGTVYLTNRDTEFFTVNAISGSFTSEEWVGVEGANAVGTVAVTAGNNTIVGTSTTFESTYSVGEVIVIRPTSNTYEVLEISAIASNTSLTVVESPISSNASANYFASVAGQVSLFNANEPARLFLDESLAKTGSVFAANDTIFGATSGSTATIESVDDQEVSYVQPHIYRSNFMRTSTSLEASTLSTSSTTYSAKMPFNKTKYLTKKDTLIKSRSNEISNDSGAKSFSLQIDLENLSSTSVRDTSPLIDHEISNIHVFQNMINNDSTDETTEDGAAESKYISRVVELADGLDAEDLKVFLTAYRPPNSDIKIYGRFQHSADPRPFDEIEWTEMTLKDETDLYSSAANRFDYREMEFNVPTGNSSYGSAGSGAWINEDNGDGSIIRYVDENGAIYDTYKYFALKIVMLATAHNNVPRLADVRSIALSA